jgi:hypothetical protein
MLIRKTRLTFLLLATAAAFAAETANAGGGAVYVGPRGGAVVGWRPGPHVAYVRPAPVVVRPARVVVRPAPVYVHPAPVYAASSVPLYLRPAPVYVAPAPIFVVPPR